MHYPRVLSRIPQVLLILAAVVVLTSVAGASPQYKVLYGFTGGTDGGGLWAPLEYAFGTGSTPLGGGSGISPDYKYADVLVMDRQPAPPNNYSLYDFFDWSQNPRPRPTINGAKYGPSCFTGPLSTNCFTSYPVDPDNDADETD